MTIKTRNMWLLALPFATAINAAQLTVDVQNIKNDEGKIGCALFDSDNDFPMSDSPKQQLWLDAAKDGVQCIFDSLEDGTYAVAISHDLNVNQETDTNFFGIPKEDWGVSNNVRPSMRAPTFEEAKFAIQGDTILEVRID